MKCSFHEIQHFPQPSVGPLGPGALRWTSGSEPLRDSQGWGGDPEITWAVRIHGFFWVILDMNLFEAHFGKLHERPTNKLVVRDSKWMVGELLGTCVMDSF